MPKTTAPLLSFGASGQIGKTLVASKWRGRQYMREYVIPSNPQTTEQSLTRNTFTWLQRVYKTAPALFIAPWARYITGKVLTDRNAFTKFNLPVLRPETDLIEFIFSPGAFGGLPPSAAVCTPGNDQLSIAITAPSIVPSGWSVDGAVAACIRDQDPATGTFFDITAGEDLTAAYTVVLTGLANTALYSWGAWLRWLRPGGTFAYSTAIVRQDKNT